MPTALLRAGSAGWAQRNCQEKDVSVELDLGLKGHSHSSCVWLQNSTIRYWSEGNVVHRLTANSHSALCFGDGKGNFDLHTYVMLTWHANLQAPLKSYKQNVFFYAFRQFSRERHNNYLCNKFLAVFDFLHWTRYPIPMWTQKIHVHLINDFVHSYSYWHLLFLL